MYEIKLNIIKNIYIKLLCPLSIGYFSCISKRLPILSNIF